MHGELLLKEDVPLLGVVILGTGPPPSCGGILKGFRQRGGHSVLAEWRWIEGQGGVARAVWATKASQRGLIEEK